MRIKNKLQIGLIALIIFVSIQIVLALQVPNFGDYDQDGDIDFVMTEIMQNQDNETFYEMNQYYGIYPVEADYGFFINANNDSYLDVYLVYRNSSNQMFIYNNTNSTFINITETAGVGGNDSLAANTADFNDDGCADLFANNKLFYGYGNTSFRDVTNQSNLAELPKLKSVIPWDFNEDNLTDILGLNESGNEVILMLNMGDNNNDGINEFWDASTLSQLTDLTKSDLASSIANSITSGWILNHTHNVTDIRYLISGIYLPRNGTDLLYDTTLSSVYSDYTYTSIPEFRWINVSARFIGNTTYIMQNSTDAIFVDLDNNTVDDLLISGSLTYCLSYGDNVYVPLLGNCSVMNITDDYGEGVDQDTRIVYITADPGSTNSPNIAGKKAAGGSTKGKSTASKKGSMKRNPPGSGPSEEDI